MLLRNCPTDPYKKFVGFYTRSQHAFVNYSLVLDAALSLEVEEFGELNKEQCVSIFFLLYVIIHIVFILENHDHLKVYCALHKGIPQFSTNFLEFWKEPEELEVFAKLVSFVFLHV